MQLVQSAQQMLQAPAGLVPATDPALFRQTTAGPGGNPLPLLAGGRPETATAQPAMQGASGTVAREIPELRVYPRPDAQAFQGSAKNIPTGETGINLRDAPQTSLQAISELFALKPEPAASVKPHAFNLEALASIGDNLQTPLASQAGVHASTALARDAASAPLKLSVPQTLDAPDWGENFAQRVSLAAGQNIKHAQLYLNPSELGPMVVRISLHNDEANISFHSQHGAVRDAVEAALPRLREMMADQGISQLNVDVSDQHAGQQAGTDGRDRQDAESTAAGHAGNDARTGADPLLSRSSGNIVIQNGLVDAFA